MSDPTKTIANGGPDRAVADSPERIIEALMRIHSMRMECCLPAIVKDYNRKSHLALVQPLTNIVSSDGEQMERADIIVPVRRIQHGAFLVDFPIYKGDTGWLIAADRDSETSLLSNSGDVDKDNNPNQGGQKPSTGILHKYRFGFFIPDRWGNINLPNDYGVGSNDAVICSRNGKTKIVLSQDGNAIISLDGSLDIQSPVTINGNVHISGSLDTTGDISSSGGISATDAIHSSSDISAEGNIISDSDMVVNVDEGSSISLKNHTHMYPHVHTTPFGDTTSQNPEETQEPESQITGPREVSVNMTISNNITRCSLLGVMYDRLSKKSTGTQQQTTSIGSIESGGTKEITFKIKIKENDSFVSSPYFRLSFSVYDTSYNAYANISNSGMRSSSVTSTDASSSKSTGQTGSNTKTFLMTMNFSQYLSGDLSKMRDINMTLNISGNISLTSSSGPVTQNYISYTDNSFVCEWDISQSS